MRGTRTQSDPVKPSQSGLRAAIPCTRDLVPNGARLAGTLAPTREFLIGGSKQIGLVALSQSWSNHLGRARPVRFGFSLFFVESKLAA